MERSKQVPSNNLHIIWNQCDLFRTVLEMGISRLVAMFAGDIHGLVSCSRQQQKGGERKFSLCVGLAGPILQTSLIFSLLFSISPSF